MLCTHAYTHAHTQNRTKKCVSQLLDGGELLDAVAGLATYTEHDARQIAIALLGALAHAHEDARCVHRDLCPENLLLSRDPVNTEIELGGRVKIVGWGRSKRLPASGLIPGEPCFGMKGARIIIAFCYWRVGPGCIHCVRGPAIAPRCVYCRIRPFFGTR